MLSSYGDPFARLQQELERMLSSFEGPFTGAYPPLNAFDSGDEVVLKAELPGVDPEKLDVEVRDNTVTITGERMVEREGRVSPARAPQRGVPPHDSPPRPPGERRGEGRVPAWRPDRAYPEGEGGPSAPPPGRGRLRTKNGDDDHGT
jgi:Hsp20/alpha crystallin family